LQDQIRTPLPEEVYLSKLFRAFLLLFLCFKKCWSLCARSK